MKTQEYLDNLKKEYKSINATLHLKKSGWSEIENQLLAPEPRRSMFFRNLAISFAVVLILLAGTYKIALAAVPGDPLYPVKIFSEKIIQKASGSNQIVIDHRAQEIIKLSKEQGDNTQNLQDVVTQYKDNVDQAKQKMSQSGQSDPSFQQKLDANHSEFDQAARNNPEIQKEIKPAQDASDSQNSQEDQGSHDNQDNHERD